MTVKELLEVMPEIEITKIIRKINPDGYIFSEPMSRQSVIETYGNYHVIKAIAIASCYLDIYIK